MTLAEVAYLVGFLIPFAVLAAGLWRIFEKANEPGWAALVPIYNYVKILKIGGNPWWYLAVPLVLLTLAIGIETLLPSVPSALSIVPILLGVIAVTFAVYVRFKMFIDLSKEFGQGAILGVLMAIFPFLYLLLGFGGYTYQKNRIDKEGKKTVRSGDTLLLTEYDDDNEEMTVTVYEYGNAGIVEVEVDGETLGRISSPAVGDEVTVHKSEGQEVDIKIKKSGYF